MLTAAELDAAHYPGWSHENKGPLILGVTGTLTFIAFLFVVGRIYSRFVSLGKLGSDDYIVILCIVSTWQPNLLISLAVRPARPSPSHLC